MKSGRLKSSVLLVLIPLVAGAVSLESLWEKGNDDLAEIHGSWEWVGSFAGVTRYRVYPEKGRKRFLEAVKNRVLVYNEDGRILAVGAFANDTVTFQINDNFQLENIYQIRNDSLFIQKLGNTGSDTSSALSIYVRTQ